MSIVWVIELVDAWVLRVVKVQNLSCGSLKSELWKGMVESDKKIPEIGLSFRNPDEAWQFWVAYGGRTGFDVRKRYTNISKFDRQVTLCRYVCANEGYRSKGQTDHVTKCFRAETRTACKARMTISLDREKGNYEVTDLVLEQNSFEPNSFM